MDGDPLSKIEAMVERARIAALLARYARAVDGKDEAALTACFTDELGVQGTAVGPMGQLFASRSGFAEGAHTTAAEWAAMILASMRLKGATQHDIGTALIAFSDATHATCDAYLRAMHFTPERPTAGFYEVGGTYRHDLERGLDGWRISYWRLEIRWEHGDYAVMASAVPR